MVNVGCIYPTLTFYYKYFQYKPTFSANSTIVLVEVLFVDTFWLYFNLKICVIVYEKICAL